MADNFNTLDTGAGGGGDVTGSQEMQSSGNASQNFVYESVDRITPTAWATFKTITLNETSTGSYGRGIVEVILAGATANVASGLHQGKWYFDWSNGAPTVAQIGTDVSSGTGAPDFRLQASGDNVVLQAQSSNGTDTATLTAHVRITLPGNLGAKTYTIS